MDSMMEVIGPALSALLMILVPLIGAAVVQWFRKMGIEIEEKYRNDLQSALANAAAMAVGKVKEQPVPPPVPGTNQRAPQAHTPITSIPIGIAVDYVQKSVPDALSKFGLDQNRIIDLLQPHLVKALANKVSSNQR